MFKLDRECALKILNICKFVYGRSKYITTYPQLKILKHIKYNNTISTGHYMGGKMSIYINKISDLDELIKTIIHEYHHYLLDPAEYIQMETELKELGLSDDEIYKQHPHELLCEQAEKDYNRIKTFLYNLNETEEH